MATTNETIPKKVVGEKMKVFEDAYNRNDIATCTSFYAKECLLTVNGGREFTGKTREELTDFFDKLRNEQGATNLKIVVIKLDGNVHVDNWVTDDCAGSCTVTWGKCEGEWVIVKEENTTFPKAA